MAESFDTLWNYCSSNNRAIPRDWNKLWQMLTNKKQKIGGGWEPPLPLILAAWHETTPLEKHLRFKEHIQWADKYNQLNEIGPYLKSLPENEWYHFGELPT
jgi:hypothetical protein